MADNEEYEGEWVLRNKKGKIIEHDKNVITIIEKGKEYSPGEVSIEQKIPHGTCFFQIQMSHSTLLNFTFGYSSHAPSIPIRLEDQQNNSLTPVFDAMIDSGSDEIIIPKRIADYLHYNLEEREQPIHTVGGEKEGYKAVVDFRMGRGGREVEYTDIEVCVVDEQLLPVLLGRKPIFQDYKIIIMDYDKKVKLVKKDQ